MKYTFWILVISLSFDLVAQDRLVFGTKCICADFADKYDTTTQFVELGEHKVFPKLITPNVSNGQNINEFIQTKLGEINEVELDLLYSILVDRHGQIDCIYLMRGAVSPLSREIALIIRKEFKFEPAMLRKHEIEAPFYLRVNL